MTTADDIRVLIVEFLGPSLVPQPSSNNFDDSTDLRQAGLIDSLGFLRLLSELEGQLGMRIDLASLAPDQMTQVGPLCRHIAAQRQHT